MNAITNALKDIKFAIPAQILNLAFTEANPYVNKMTSLDERIMSALIRPRVLVDCNLVGGVMARVDLANCSVTMTNTNEYIVNIPKTLTNNRSIIVPLSIVSNIVYSQTGVSPGISPMLSAASNMYNNLGNEVPVQTARLDMIGDNILLIQEPSIYMYFGILRCMVENSPNMENIQPRSFAAFSELCILACKSYIYRELRVKLDQGYIYGGHELGYITEEVEKYADAEEMYKEYRNTTWRKVAYLNNSNASTRHIEMMLGNTL